PHIPAGMQATLHVQGPRGRVVLEQKVTLSDFGSFDADIQLPNEVVGYFRASLLFSESDDAEWTPIATGFNVQEYQPNAFEVKITEPGTPRLGAPIEMPIGAKYYMGQPLTKAQVS